MTWYLMFLVLLIAIVVPTPTIAGHPHQCSSIINVENALALQYMEAVKGVGLTGRAEAGIIAKMFVSINGSWSLIYEFIDGSACVMAGGTEWHDVEWKPGRRS